MDGLDGGNRRRKSFKERLGLKGMGCCGGATWGIRPSTLSVRDDDYDLELEDESPSQQQQEEQEPNQNQQIEAVRVDVGQTPPENISDPDCDGQIPAGSGMNLATALAAERQFRATQESDGTSVVGPTSTTPTRDGPSVGTAPGTPLRVSLMRLLEESDGGDGEAAKEKDLGSDSLCCVCMGRKKGAAFIPCGHTFCRVCSRELWLNRGSCPLCNRTILEILDIF